MKDNFIIPYVIYPFEAMVSLGESDEEVNNSLIKWGIDKKEAIIDSYLAAGQAFMFEQGQTLIRLKVYPTTYKNLATLQHEILHAVSYLMTRIGIKFSDDSEEAYTYMVQYITEKIYEKLDVKISEKGFVVANTPIEEPRNTH